MRRCILALGLLVSAGCSGGADGPDATPCPMELAWGRDRAGDFAPFGDGDRAEITLGFQGFRYISSSLRMIMEGGDRGQVWFQIAVAGHEPYAVSSGLTVSAPEADGARYADNVLVFFNDIPMPELVGRSATIGTRVSAGGCAGSTSVGIILANDDNCVELEDGTLSCPDDTP
jgi:hypothetical protein